MDLQDANRFMLDGACALTFVEQQGITIDVDYCRAKLDWIGQKLKQAEARVIRSPLGKAWEARYGATMRFASVPQLRSVLYADLHAKPFKQSNSGEDSVDEESLRQTHIEGIEPLLRMRHLKKAQDVLKQFVRYQIDGKLYPSFNLHTVATYRSSSSDPNMQNVPKRDKESMDICRAAIKPSPGNILIEVDFSGLEVSIAACYHKDPVMMRYLNDPASDMHADQAVELFKLPKRNDLKSIAGFGTLRQASKNSFVFPEFYGDYYVNCAFGMACTWCKLPQNGMWTPEHGVQFNGSTIGAHLVNEDIDSLSAFTDHVQKVEDDFWNRRFKVYHNWRKNWYNRYTKRGYFDMKTGFRCSGVLAKNQSINYPVQGSAFHCLLWSLIELVKVLKHWRSKVISQVHDSVILDVHPDEFTDVVELVQRITTVDLLKAWDWIIVPLRVEVSAGRVDEPWSMIQVVA